MASTLAQWMMKAKNTMNRSYSELSKLQTFEERYNYLKLNGKVGEELFGYARYLNQVFYQRSALWKKARQKVILRDNGCDLGVEGRDIKGAIYVHHMNPITIKMLKEEDPMLTDPENLICCSRKTHEAITLGLDDLLPKEPIARFANDMCPWKL